MPRTVIVGDVHGCIDELRALLQKVGYTSADNLYFLGDLVGRGPDTIAVLDLVIEAGAKGVRGNHEDKLLGYLKHEQGQGPVVRLGPSHLDVVKALKNRHWKLLDAFPYWMDIPEHSLRLVHAGLLPDVDIEQQDPEVLTTIRSLGANGKAQARRSGEDWGKWYQGPPHVVYGHNALMRAQVFPWATGIDTGCVYGGFLTAMVLEGGHPVPPTSERSHALVSVPARKKYYPVRANRRAG